MTTIAQVVEAMKTAQQRLAAVPPEVRIYDCVYLPRGQGLRKVTTRRGLPNLIEVWMHPDDRAKATA